jgi:hypothetical protein
MRRHAMKQAARRALAWTPLLLVALAASADPASTKSHATRPLAALPSIRELASPLPAGEAPDSLTGTVRAVDAKSGTLELIVGVGYALRLVTVQVARDTQLKLATAGLANIIPGSIVRVRYLQAARERRAAIARVAISIERLSIPESGGAR